MSEKKSKEKRRTINVPRYNLQEQLDFVKSFCESVQFDADLLTGLILADFLYTIELTAFQSGGDYKVAFLSYLEHSVRVYENFLKLKEDIQDAQKTESGKE